MDYEKVPSRGKISVNNFRLRIDDEEGDIGLAHRYTVCVAGFGLNDAIISVSED